MKIYRVKKFPREQELYEAESVVDVFEETGVMFDVPIDETVGYYENKEDAEAKVKEIEGA